ncbi:hypothetical protein ACI3PF_20890, partial [Lactococcus lactis]
FFSCSRTNNLGWHDEFQCSSNWSNIIGSEILEIVAIIAELEPEIAIVGSGVLLLACVLLSDGFVELVEDLEVLTSLFE